MKTATRTGNMMWSVGTTGMFSVQGRRCGRGNHVAWVVVCGSKVIAGGVQGGKDAALALAERCDRMVATWRKA